VVLNFIDNALLKGPWDMVADDVDPANPVLYVSDVLSGSVVRINFRVTLGRPVPAPDIQSIVKIASGFPFRTDPNALLLGPTGLALDHARDLLYVADTAANRINLLTEVSHAESSEGPGKAVSFDFELKGPLSVALTPTGTLLATNGDAVGKGGLPNELVEVDPSSGRILGARQLVAGAPGALFGLAVVKFFGRNGILFVDDGNNTLNVLPAVR
jgi:hypothetical protein